MRLVRQQEFWEIELDDRVYTIRTGRIGTRGKSERFPAPTADQAQRAHDDAIVKALGQGFLEIPATSPAGLDIRNDALEQALRDHRDRDTYLVYADWLQAAGNPVGELVALAIHAEGARHDPKVAKRIDTLRAALRLPLPDRVTYRFRWGLFEWLRIENLTKQPSTVLDTMPPLFAHVMCCALDRMTIGALDWNQDRVLVPKVIEEAGRHAWATGLRHLHIGRDDPAKPESAHYLGDYDAGELGGPISKAFPGLETLRVQSGLHGRQSASSLADLDLPRLRELVLVAGWFSEGRYNQLVSMKVPALTRLELWLGAESSERLADPTQIKMLFEAGRFASVRDLALRSSRHADGFAAAIPSWPIAAKLETLDLSWGTLSDDGAKALLVNPRKFASLQRLVVDENYLSDDAVRALGARFPKVSAKAQRPPTTANQRVIAYQPGYVRPNRR